MNDQIKVVNTINKEREVHMMGEHVAVCWNTKEKKFTLVKDGMTYRATENVRSGKPYIAFVWLREWPDGWYEDDDNVGEGGMEPETAKEVRDELTLAIQYLREQEAKLSDDTN